MIFNLIIYFLALTFEVLYFNAPSTVTLVTLPNITAPLPSKQANLPKDGVV